MRIIGDLQPPQMRRVICTVLALSSDMAIQPLPEHMTLRITTELEECLLISESQNLILQARTYSTPSILAGQEMKRLTASLAVRPVNSMYMG